MSILITNTQSQTNPEGIAGVLANPTPAEQFLAEAERVRAVAAGQLVVSQSRCVDHLLDLLNLATEPAVRAVLGAGLAAIRRLSSVEGADLLRTVALAVAAAHVESSYDELVLEPFLGEAA